ncbi:AAA family ATPase [Paenibacillus sp. FSL H7-0714]|uniref:AAA family ATPase n=1 Tax=Paenibacillus sp. FSL H7-0714 TaxID=2954735 RepID=UPI0030FB2015
MTLIKIISATAHNFKAHRDLIVTFGERTEITGDNAQGKSSILELISWTLYGTDVLGSKLDPTPTNYKYDIVKAELLLEVDGNQFLLGRGIEKNKATYYINEVPAKAGDFEEIVKSLFDRDLFLSLFNPTYFFTLHWSKQRELMMRFTTPPAAKEVFVEMSRLAPEQKFKDITLNPQAAKLQELTKKHTRPQLKEIHTKNKADKDTAYKRAQGKVEALEGQLLKLTEAPTDIEAVKAEDAELYVQIEALQQKIELADEPKRKRMVLESSLASAQQKVAAAKERYLNVHGEVISEECPTCKRALDPESIESVKANKEERKAPLRAEHDQAVTERKAIEANLAAVELIDVSELIEQRNALEKLRDVTATAIHAQSIRAPLQTDLDKARSEETDTLASRNDSIFILDALKAYEAKEAELQAAKVQGMFTTLTISLFKEIKSTGEREPKFEIERDNKPYSKLSRSERAHAGIELAAVLSEMGEIIAPLAVDDSESVFRIKQPKGQLILVKAVEDQKLDIK